jgi:SAM-dependent methyltransferase
VTGDDERIAAYYDGLVGRFGLDPRSVDAATAAGLDARYRVLSEVTDLSGKQVLDVGCGYGGFGAYLQAAGVDADYVGIDISRGLLDTGHSVHPELDLREGSLRELHAPGAYDVVVAQGIFYLLGDDAEVKMAAMIRQMWDLAREAVAFTTMSAWAGDAPEGEFFAQPERLLSICTQLTTRLVLRHDYHPRDVALYLYRGV